MEIDLDNLSHNIKAIKEKTGKDIIAVVKSDAYGYGSVPIVRKLTSLGIGKFAVNDIEEAIELCQNNIHQDILILNSLDYNDYAHLYKYSNLVLSINSLDDALELNQYYYGINTKVHIHIDTGMNRLGINNLDEYLDVLNILQNNEKFIIEGIYTHFISSDPIIIDRQVDVFSSLVKRHDYKVIHCANSGALDYTDFGNYIRIGIGMYGTKQELKPVLNVKTKPLWVKKILKGESIGYEQKFIATQDTIVALLPVGYGNGYIRSFEGFYLLANNKKYDIIGHICMNHLFVEVDETIDAETIFYLINEHLPVDELAEYINTTPHQISCMLKIKNKKYIDER